MNPDLWAQHISKTEAPPYPCPHCGNGILVLEPATLVQRETAASSQLRSSDASWDPVLLVQTFSCWLRCAAPKCGESVAVMGMGYAETVFDEEDGTRWELRFAPKFAWPMPRVFAIPDECPEEISGELRASFRAIWTDPAAAASRLRIAIERLLDHVGIRRRERTTRGYRAVRLHQRIELLSTAQPDAAKNLMALKWLGNTGSHESAVTLADLLAAYEVMEPTLDAMLGERKKRIALLAKRLTKKHGSKPRAKKRAVKRQ